MNKISINEIFNLRKKTGLGVMLCKKALLEVNGDVNKAIELLKNNGKKLSNIKINNQNNYGVVLAKTNLDNNIGVAVILTCETDFVAKNKTFIDFANELLEISLLCNDKYSLLNYKIDKMLIKDKITEYMNILGEYIELKIFEKIYSPFISYYVHNGNKIASLVGFTEYHKGIEGIGRDISMQIVGMNPKWIDYNDMNHDKHNSKELDENILEKILLHQPYIKNTKISVKDYIENFNKNIKISIFKRFIINNI